MDYNILLYLIRPLSLSVYHTYGTFKSGFLILISLIIWDTSKYLDGTVCLQMASYANFFISCITQTNYYGDCRFH